MSQRAPVSGAEDGRPERWDAHRAGRGGRRRGQRRGQGGRARRGRGAAHGGAEGAGGAHTAPVLMTSCMPAAPPAAVSMGVVVLVMLSVRLFSVLATAGDIMEGITSFLDVAQHHASFSMDRQAGNSHQAVCRPIRGAAVSVVRRQDVPQQLPPLRLQGFGMESAVPHGICHHCRLQLLPPVCGLLLHAWARANPFSPISVTWPRMASGLSHKQTASLEPPHLA